MQNLGKIVNLKKNILGFPDFSWLFKKYQFTGGSEKQQINWVWGNCPLGWWAPHIITKPPQIRCRWGNPTNECINPLVI